MKIYDVLADLKIKSFGDILKEYSKLTGLVGVIMDIVKEAPEDIAACTDIWGDFTATFNWIMHHLSITTVFGSIVGNLTTHMVKFATDSW